MQHILSASQFTKKDLAELFDHVDGMREIAQHPDYRRKLIEKHRGRVVATLFYEPSTRTRLSFESAAQRLGTGLISTENAAEFSSAIKGETLEDTIRIVQSYADIIVLRHKETGAAEKAAAVAKVPIINAGDGTGEHPTQALLDLYTIHHEKGQLTNLSIVIGGDLAHGRTARSLARMLSLYDNNRITFVSTSQLKIADDIKVHLAKAGVAFMETTDLKSSLRQADVVYWTRLQTERLKDKTLASKYRIGPAEMRIMPPNAILLHPLPRVDEIAKGVDKDPRAAYFRQAENGLYVRMALIDMLLG